MLLLRCGLAAWCLCLTPGKRCGLASLGPARDNARSEIHKPASPRERSFNRTTPGRPARRPQELESRKRAPLYQKKQEEELKASVEKAQECECRAVEAEMRCKEARSELEAAERRLGEAQEQLVRQAKQAAEAQEQLAEQHALELQRLAMERTRLQVGGKGAYQRGPLGWVSLRACMQGRTHGGARPAAPSGGASSIHSMHARCLQARLPAHGITISCCCPSLPLENPAIHVSWLLQPRPLLPWHDA